MYILHRLSPKCISLVRTPGRAQSQPVRTKDSWWVYHKRNGQKGQGHPVHKRGKREESVFGFWVAKIGAVVWIVRLLLS